MRLLRKTNAFEQVPRQRFLNALLNKNKNPRFAKDKNSLSSGGVLRLFPTEEVLLLRLERLGLDVGHHPGRRRHVGAPGRHGHPRGVGLGRRHLRGRRLGRTLFLGGPDAGGGLTPGSALGLDQDFVFVEGGRPGVVAVGQRVRGVPVRLALQELLGPPVSPGLHLGHLGVLPLVHGHGADEGEVDAQTAVLARALQTDPDAVRHGDPLGIVGPTLEAALKIDQRGSLTTSLNLSLFVSYVVVLQGPEFGQCPPRLWTGHHSLCVSKVFKIRIQVVKRREGKNS